MTAKENDETIFRQVEKEVLDQHHQNLPILRRREVDAIRGLLMAYGNVLRGLRNGRIPKQNDDAKPHTANEGLRAIGHCLRWIRECCPLDSSENLPIEEVPYQEAMELLRWGVKYDPLWNQHSAYSGKLVQMEVNRPTKLITFKPWDRVDPHFFCTQTESKKANDERDSHLRVDDQLADVSAAWFDSVSHDGFHIQFDDSEIGASG